MKRFDPQVGRAGQGMSAGKSHRSLQRLLRNAAAITLFAAPYVASMIPTKAAATDWTYDFGTSTTAFINYTGFTGVTNTSSLPSIAAADGGSTYIRGNSTGASVTYANPGSVYVGTGGELTLNNTNATTTVTAFSISGWTATKYFDVSFQALSSQVGSAYGQFTAGSGADYTSINALTGSQTVAGIKFLSNAVQAYNAGTWTAVTAAGLAAGSAGVFRVIGNTSTASMSYTLGSTSYTVGAGKVDYFFMTTNASSYILLADDFASNATASTLSVNGLSFKEIGGASNTGSTYTIDNIAYSNSIPAVSASSGNFYNGGATSTWSSTSANFSTSSALGGALVQSTTGVLTFGGTAGTVTVSGGVTVAAGATFTTTGYTITGSSINLTGTSAAANTITIDGTGSTATIASTLTGTNGLTKSGNGTLNLSGANTYSGTTTVSAGTLQLLSGTALGTSSVSITAGAALDLAGVTMVNANALTVNGTGISTNGSLINSNTTAASYKGAITLGSDSTITAGTGNITLTGGITTASGKSLTINGASDVTISTAKITGAGGLTKSGAGTLTLNVASDFTGGLTINAGTVSLGKVLLALGSNAVTFGSGSTGTLSLNGQSTTVASLNTDNTTPGTTFIKNGNSLLNATLTIGNTSNADSTFAGVIQDGSTGTLAINKAGTGTLTLTATNTYTGGTTLNTGTLKLSGSGALAGGTVAIGGGTLSVVNSAIVNSAGGSMSGTPNNITGNVTLNSGTIDLTAGSLSVGGDLTLSGGNINYILGKTLAVTGQLTLSAPVTVSLDGTYSVGKIYTLLSYSSSSPTPDFANNFKISFLNNTLGKWSYNSSESSAGVYKITLTSLASNLNWNLVGAGEWGTSSPANWLNTTNSTTQAFTEGDNVTFDKSNGGVIAVSGTVTPSTVTVNSEGNYTFQTGSIAGDGGITKSGNGKLTLSANNTFTGQVVVNAGTLAVNSANALGSTSAGTAVLSGATLDVTGGITLAAEALTLVGGGVNGGGALTSSTGSNTVSGPITLSGDTFISSQGTLLTLTGTITGTNSTLSIGGKADTNISGNISGAGLALNKTGDGTLTLSGLNSTYTGLTSVLSGTLVAQTATSISSSVSVASGATLSLQDNQTLTSLSNVVYSFAESGEVRIANGKTFTLNINGTSAQSFSGTFTASGGTAFTKSGSGTLTLSGASNNLSRDITVNAGTIKAANNNALGSGTIAMSAGSVYVSAGTSIANNFTIGTAGSSSLSSSQAAAGWDFSTTTTTTAVGPLAASTSAAGLTVGSLTKGSGLTASGTATKFGAFSGWSNGTASSGLVASDQVFADANGKYLSFSITTGTSAMQLTDIMAWKNQHSGTGVTTVAWEYAIGSGSYNTIGTQSTGSASTSAMPAISLAGIGDLQNIAAGTTVNFRLAGYGATGNAGTFYLLDLGNATGLDFGVNGKFYTSTPASGSGTLGIDTAGTATFSGNITNNNLLTLTATTAGIANFTGIISGAGSIIKTGAGKVELQGANTFTGSLTLTEGNLKVSTLGAGGVASPLGAGAGNDPTKIIFNGGKLEYSGSADAILTRDFTVGNDGAGFIASGTGKFTIGPDAQMDFDNAAASNRTLTLGGTTDIAVENIYNPTKFSIADINNLFTKLVKQDVNKWVVLGAGAGFVDDAATEMDINGGELDFEKGALGKNTTINVGSATLGWYNISNTEDLSGRIHLNEVAAAVFNIPLGNTVTFASALNGGAVTSASLTKKGAGTLELGAENKFSGNFNISEGTVKATNAKSLGTGNVIVGPGNKFDPKATLLLSLNPTAVLANKINVVSGGTLAGTGTDADATIEEDGILSPNADGIGTLTFNNLTLNGGAKVKWQLQNAAGAAGVGYDTLVVATLNLSNAISTKKKITVEVTSTGKASGFDKTKVNQFEFAKITTDLATGVNVTDLFSIDASQFEIANNLTNDHLVWSMQYSADRDMMYITTMIPEPSTYGLGLSALALAVVAVRRRQKKKK